MYSWTALKTYFFATKTLTSFPYTPLYIASRYGCVEIVRILLALKNIDAKKPCNNGDTPLFGASFHGHAEVVRALLAIKDDKNKIDVNKPRTDNGCTPLFVASQNGHVEVI